MTRMVRWPRVARLIRRLAHPPAIDVDELIVGRNVVIGSDVDIRCERLVLGDGVVIRSGTRIEVSDLVLGDYTKINNHSLLTGTNWCRLGHNCWVGHYSVIDSIGTTRIGNGVGIGAHSQLWSHIYFGDTLEGSRFASESPLVIEDDVWFVGHCIVSPILARARSMALVGSVITKQMEPNRIYGGSPAKDMSDRIGGQFETRSVEDRRMMMERHLQDFLTISKPSPMRIEIVDAIDLKRPAVSQFSVTERMYLKNLYPEEVAFMRYLLPWRAKFVPHPSTDWVARYLND